MEHVGFSPRARGEHAQPERAPGSVTRELPLPAESFIDRFLHVVPPHVPPIRHVGFLANCTKKARLAQCRRLLNAAPPPCARRRSNGPPWPASIGPVATTITRARWSSSTGCPDTAGYHRAKQRRDCQAGCGQNGTEHSQCSAWMGRK